MSDYYVTPGLRCHHTRACFEYRGAYSLPAEESQKEAIVLLSRPPAPGVLPPALRRWLRQLDVEPAATPGITALSRVLAALRRDVAEDHLGALRFWGRTGERPSAWLAAADPVYLEARLDHVVIRRLADRERLAEDLEAAFDVLQDHLGGEGGLRFRAAGAEGYLSAAKPMLTAAEPPSAVYGRELGSVLPAGRCANEYQRLQSEIQMVLHQARFQERRMAAGYPPINGLWIWGGGSAGSPAAEPLPPLYARDPLLRGYWYQRGQGASVWPGSLLACAAQSAAGFVAAVSARADQSADGACLETLLDAQRLLVSGRLSVVRFSFDTGVSVRARRRRWWHPRRNDLSWLEAGGTE